MQNIIQNRIFNIAIFGVLALVFTLVVSQVAFAQSDKSKGKGADHRSAISSVVEELNAIAEKDKGIGSEVSAVAKEQDESKTKVAEAMEKIEGRSAFKTFLIGTDYKNIGAIRSEMVTTDNHISRLEKAAERSNDPAVVVSLNEQIAVLEGEKAQVETFLIENESKFSLFGWFVKFFN